MPPIVNPVVSDGHGNIFEVPGLQMLGMGLFRPILLRKEDLVPLPEGSDLFELPGRTALAEDPKTGEIVEVKSFQGRPVLPVTAFMAPAYIQIARTAYRSRPDAPLLPLFSYTAVGWWKDKFYVAGERIDQDQRQDLKLFKAETLQKAASVMLKRFPANRLVHHLVYNCVFRYGCPAARNFVLERWECPAPVSPYCNAQCLGCLSLQPRQAGIESSMERISFIPECAELVEFCLPHLQNAPRPVISFGQGCEGEPLLQGDLIAETIRTIRRQTKRGIININTNGSRPDVVEKLCTAGLDSIRISLNSARKIYYERYFKPRTYSFENVLDSLRVATRFGKWTSINYFISPGFTDLPEEMIELDNLLQTVPINMIQTRNLNCDPELYRQKLEIADTSQLNPVGMKEWLLTVRKKYPAIRLGYFNPPRQIMDKHIKRTM